MKFKEAFKGSNPFKNDAFVNGAALSGIVPLSLLATGTQFVQQLPKAIYDDSKQGFPILLGRKPQKPISNMPKVPKNIINQYHQSRGQNAL